MTQTHKHNSRIEKLSCQTNDNTYNLQYNAMNYHKKGYLMKTFLMILEFLSGILLIGAVLLHSPKGEGLGGIGGAAHMYRSQKGMESGLNKLTAVIAGIFMVAAIILGMIV